MYFDVDFIAEWTLYFCASGNTPASARALLIRCYSGRVVLFLRYAPLRFLKAYKKKAFVKNSLCGCLIGLIVPYLF